MKKLRLPISAAAAVLALCACGGNAFDATLPQLKPATGAALPSCTDLSPRISFANPPITAANAVAAGTLTIAGTPVPAHCQVTGRMFDRVSAIDGNNYAIGF